MDKIELKAPESWAELSLDDFRFVAKFMMENLSREEFLIIMFCHFTGVKIVRSDGELYKFVHDGKIFFLSNPEVADLCGRFSWLYDTAPDVVPNPSKMDAMIRDMSFIEYYKTDVQMRLYEKDRDLAHFDTILPLLNEEVRSVDADEALVYSMWWHTVETMLMRRYPNVFRQSDGGSEDGDPFGTLQNIHLMLNDNRPQDNAQIDNANVHDVLSALNNKMEEIRFKNEQIEKMK